MLISGLISVHFLVWLIILVVCLIITFVAKVNDDLDYFGLVIWIPGIILSVIAGLAGFFYSYGDGNSWGLSFLFITSVCSLLAFILEYREKRDYGGYGTASVYGVASGFFAALGVVLFSESMLSYAVTGRVHLGNIWWRGFYIFAGVRVLLLFLGSILLGLIIALAAQKKRNVKAR